MWLKRGEPREAGVRRIRSAVWPLLVAALVLLTVYLLKPVREMPLEDDWAYARTVERLVQTGRYELHPWLSANMPFQAFWGAMFTLLLGPGFASLRISTLVLSIGGLYAFYRLLCIGGRSEAEAAVGVLLLWSSPLYLRFSFNFMTDVPFTALMLISLWLYSVAWSRMSYGAMAIAAVAGTATVLTRQFGLALIPALVVMAWLRRSAARTPALISVAVIPLVLGVIYQLTMGISAPTWAQQINLQAQQALMNNWRLQLYELLWRPGVILQYLCLFTLPLAIAVSVRWIRNSLAVPPSRGFLRISLGVAVTLGLCVAIGLAAHKGVALPTIPWNFEGLRDFSKPARLSLTAIIMIMAVPYTATLITRIRADLSAKNPEVTAALFHATILALLPFTLAYHQFGDEYLLVYVAWVTWTIARWSSLWSRSTALTLAAVALFQLAVVTIWVDEILSRNQVQWQAARNTVERLHISPASISAGWTWATYYAFDDYLARHPSDGQVDFSSLFDEWLPAYDNRAEYRVEVSDRSKPSPSGDLTLVQRQTLTGHVLRARAERVR
jgi:hypothetical protein